MSDETVKAEKAVKKAAPAAGFCCYIGPSITGYIQKGTLYAGEKAEVLKLPEVKLATGKFPETAALIVDGFSVDESERQIKTKGSALYEKVQRLLDRK